MVYKPLFATGTAPITKKNGYQPLFHGKESKPEPLKRFEPTKMGSQLFADLTKDLQNKGVVGKYKSRTSSLEAPIKYPEPSKKDILSLGYGPINYKNLTTESQEKIKKDIFFQKQADKIPVSKPFAYKTPTEKAQYVTQAFIGDPIRFVISSGLELAKSEAELTPVAKGDLFVFGAEPIKRLTKDASLEGEAFRFSEEKLKQVGVPEGIATKTSLAGALLIGALVENPFIGGSSKGGKVIFEKALKESLEKELGRGLAQEEVEKIATQADIILKIEKKADREAATKTLISEIKGTKASQTGLPATQVSQDVAASRLAQPTLPARISPETPISQKLSLSSPSETNLLQIKKEVNAIENISKIVREPIITVKRVVGSIKKSFRDVIEFVQDSETRVKKLVERKDVKVTEGTNPYLKATLYSGRVSDRIEEGYKETKEIIKEMNGVAHDTKLDLIKIRQEVSDYLRFKHAPERNAILGDGAAGVTTKEAEEGLKKIESTPYSKQVKAIAERALKLHERTLVTLKDSGVISEDLYKGLKEKYKTHVPLLRIFEDSENVSSILSGKGFDVRSTGIKRAIGSEREVDDILTNIVSNYEQAILRSEKNIVDQATLAFARNNKDILGDLFEVVKPKAIGQTFDGRIVFERTNDPTILQLYENGKPIWIKIKDQNLAIALRGVGKEKIGPILNAVGSFTRLYSGLATRFNPEFALPNKIRDLQETMVYLMAQKDVGFKGASKIITKDPSSVKGVFDSLRGVDSPESQLYKEMKSMGGTTGGFGLSTKKQTSLNIKKLQDLETSKTKKVFDNLIEYVDNWNTIFEDSTRLSVYRQGLEQGLPKERAAFLAKEASINFNRMGKGGPVINAIWMFSNASIQGSAKTLRSLKNPKVLGAVALTVGSSVAAVNTWNDKVDPQWRDKVSKWDRLNGLPIVIPTTDGGSKYVVVPVSWGLKPIKVMADYAYDITSNVDTNIQDAINDTMVALLESYNPAGGADFVSAITPTLIDIPVEIARNKSWSGYKIRPDFDPNAPDDIQYFNSLGETVTGETAISISEILQDKANIAISPANMKYAYDSYVGGAGRTISKVFNIISGGVSGKPAPIDEYPLISRFYRQRTEEEVGAGTTGETKKIRGILESQSRERFDIKKQAEVLDMELIKLPPEDANERYKQLKSENPVLAAKLKDVTEERKLGLTYTEKLMKQLGVENGERAKYVNEQILKLPTADEKNAYYQELKDKKIITDQVAKQIKKLLNE